MPLALPPRGCGTGLMAGSSPGSMAREGAEPSCRPADRSRHARGQTEVGDLPPRTAAAGSVPRLGTAAAGTGASNRQGLAGQTLAQSRASRQNPGAMPLTNEDHVPRNPSAGSSPHIRGPADTKLADFEDWGKADVVRTIGPGGSTGTSGTHDTTVSPVTPPTSCDDSDGRTNRGRPQILPLRNNRHDGYKQARFRRKSRCK